ncbi:MAG: glycosyltransferase [Planctomycetota bacterium]
MSTVEQPFTDETREAMTSDLPDPPTSDRPEVSLIVAVTDWRAEVLELFEQYSEQLDGRGMSFEFLFVIDGVQGDEGLIQDLKDLKAAHPDRIGVIRFKQAFGESVAIAAGMEASRGELLVTVPQYIQIDPQEIHQILDGLRSGSSDMIVSCRSPRVDALLNRVQSTLFNFLMKRLTRTSFNDLNCNFRGMTRSVIEEIPIHGDLYRFLPVMALRHGFRVDEVRVRHVREWGKMGFFGFGVYTRRVFDILVLVFITKFTKKPLRFFGVIGSFFMLIGLLICGWLSIEKIFYAESLRDRPLLILGVALFVLGVQTISIGLVGEIVIFTQGRNIKDYQIERIHGGRDEDEG